MINPFLKTESYQVLQQALTDGAGPLAVTGTVDPVKAQLLVSLSAASKRTKRGASKDDKHPWKLLVVKD